MTPVPAEIVERLRRLDRLLAQAVEDSDGNWEDTVTDLGFVMTALLVSHDNAEHRRATGGGEDHGLGHAGGAVMG